VSVVKSYVLGDGQGHFDCLCVSDGEVTVVTEQRAYPIGAVAVIDAELAAPMGADVTTGRLPANSAFAILLGNHARMIFWSNSVAAA